MGVKAVKANSPLEARLARIEKADLPGRLAGSESGTAYLISTKENNSFIAVNRILKKGGSVSRAKEAFSANGKTHPPPGTFIVESPTIARDLMEKLARELSLEIERAGRVDLVKRPKLKLPRIAIYKSWTADSDEGWTRWVLEQFEFPFVSLHDAEIKAGSLSRRFDALVIPSMSTEDIVAGNRPGTLPPDYVGGIGEAGVANIVEFVKDGGTLITLNSSCDFAIVKIGVPATDALSNVRGAGLDFDDLGKKAKSPEFDCPGSILRMNFNPRHPVAYGLPEQGAGVFYYSPAFRLLPADLSGKGGEVIAYYPDESLLISGYIKGEKYLRNRIAAAAFPLEKGRVVLLGFGVQNRAQSYGTFKLLFNAFFY